MVYDGEDCIVPSLLRKSGNQVHGNLLEWESSFTSCNAIEGCLLFVRDNLILLTVCTSLYVIGYPLTHSDPSSYFGGFLDGFISSWVSCCGVIVDDGYQLAFFCFGG